MMRQQLRDVVVLVINIKIQPLLIAITLLLTGHVCLSIRLKLFFASQDISVTVKEAFGLTLIGYFFNNFLPTSVGGDMVKAYYASKKTNGKIGCLTSVFMDRFVGLLSFFILIFCALVLLKGELTHAIMAWPLWMTFTAMAAFLLVLVNKRIASIMLPLLARFRTLRIVHHIYTSFLAFRNKKMLFVKAFLISIGAQAISFIGVYYLIRSLYAHVPLLQVLLRPYPFEVSLVLLVPVPALWVF